MSIFGYFVRAGFFLLTVVPLGASLVYSLLYSLGMVGLLSEGFTLSHWQALFSNSDALGSIGYTLGLAFVSLGLALLLALVLAWGFFRGRLQAWTRPFFYLPLLFPPLIAAFSWYSVLSPSGLLSRFAYSIGLLQQQSDFVRLVQDVYSIGVVFTHLFLLCPVFLLVFLRLIKSEGLHALLAVSQNLGVSARYFLVSVFAPLLLRQSRFWLLLYGVFLLGAYEVPMFLGRTSPRTITLFVQDKMARYNLDDLPQAHAMAFFYAVLAAMLISFAFLKKRQRA